MNLAEQWGALRNDLQLAAAPWSPVGTRGLGTEWGTASGWGCHPGAGAGVGAGDELEHLRPDFSLGLKKGHFDPKLSRPRLSQARGGVRHDQA